MASIIGQYLPKDYTIGKQLGSRSWEIKHVNSDQKEYVDYPRTSHNNDWFDLLWSFTYLVINRKLKLYFKPDNAFAESLESLERIRKLNDRDRHKNIALPYQVIDTGKHILFRSELCEVIEDICRTC